MTIGIVEDHLLFADLVANICTKELNATIAFRAESGAEALRCLGSQRVDLLLLDLILPDFDGIHVADYLSQTSPASRIVIISCARDEVTMYRVRHLPIAGFIDKSETTLSTLIDAIGGVISGERYFSPVVEKIRTKLARDTAAFFRLLSPWEQKILSLAGRSLSDAEIAQMLSISASTAQSRRRDIMKKLNIHSTAKLIRYATERGFTRTEFIDGSGRGPPSATG